MFKKFCSVYLIVNLSYILLAFSLGALLPAGSPNSSPIYYFALSLIYYHTYHLTYIHIALGVGLAVFSFAERAKKSADNGKFLAPVIADLLINVIWEITASFLISIR